MHRPFRREGGKKSPFWPWVRRGHVAALGACGPGWGPLARAHGCPHSGADEGCEEGWRKVAVGMGPRPQR